MIISKCAKTAGGGISSWLSRLAILACALVLFGATASAGTVNVFAENLGTGSFQSLTTEQQAAYAAFLVDHNIDFGFFCGPNASYKVGFSHVDYTADKITAATGGIHAFIYKTSRWTVVDYYKTNYPKGTGEEWQSVTSAYVLEDKTTHERFAFIMTTGTNYKGSYLGPVNTAINYCKNNHPDARIVFGTTKAYGLYDSSGLANTIISAGFTEVRDGTDCGAIYVQNHASRSDYAGSAVSWLSNATEPAATATVTYRQEFTVAFEDWDGTSLGEAQKVYAGDDATPPADPTREGYTFTGWSGSYQNVQASATLTAQYAINTYTVRFLDYDGTTLLKSETVDHGSDATPPADPTREGYRFTGWQGTYAGITADTDIIATYIDASAVTHWVTFYDWDNTQLSRQEIVEGEDATPPADPDNRPGWHFTGWQGNYTAVAQAETVTAVYAINTYVVTFQDWDGAELKTETVEHGSDATPPANPTRTGWHFTGWSGTYQNIQAATTITAQYEIDTFTVTFQYTNGVVIVQQTVEYLGSATKPANPAPLDEDAIFYKWDGTYTSVTNDVDVFALFVPKVIEVGTGAELAEYMSTADLLAMSGITIALTNDVSLSGVSYTARSLTATFDGRGHTISSMPSKFHLVSDIRGGTVRDVVFSGYRSPGNANSTQLVASQTYYNSTISGVVMTNCQWTVPNGSYGTAGFVYEVKQNTTITNCTMINCKVIGVNCGGNYKGEPQLLGGFVGKAASLTMVDCHFIVDNTNTIAIGDGISVAAAFVGKCGSGVTIERCSNNGRVAVKKQVYSTIGGAGGFVGIATSSGSPTIRDCANFGTVESTVSVYPAGGFIGDAGSESGTFSLTVQSCFNYGAVSSPIAAGGLIGRYRGVVSTLSNTGNSGAISSEAGFAGGLVGQICYNDANRTWRICNAMQAGAVSTMSGCAGLLVGGIEESDLVGLTLSVSNTWIAGSAAISEGGQAGILFGGRDITAENELTVELGESKVLESNASLPPYYDKVNDPKDGWESTPPPTFAASMLNDQPIRKSLNAYAATNNYTAWIRGHDYPELATFGTECKRGFFIIVR